MKYIFDFDDVLFNNTAQFKVHMFSILAEAGVPEKSARAHYLEVREKEFSLRNFIQTLFTKYNLRYSVDVVYQQIMEQTPNFLNTELVELIKKIGKENCYLVTNGDQEFNNDKVKYSGTSDLFKKIYIVPGTKKEVIRKICEENKTEEILFLEDKQKFIDDLEIEKHPNLRTILYTGQNLEPYFQ
ncbi:HAD hydrolase-like protein [Candidatus Nomurabacteria bacterium]|nr:HAD hydrolase-like protein [Candidatus Nomurabacteria bacterium]